MVDDERVFSGQVSSNSRFGQCIEEGAVPVGYGDPELPQCPVPCNPTWDEGDVLAKAEAVLEMDFEAARSVLLDNGDWDGGMADLRDPAAAPAWEDGSRAARIARRGGRMQGERWRLAGRATEEVT